METITQLEPETIDDLRDLIRANLDSAKFFREAAANVASPGLVDLFESVGRIRAKHASELQAYLRRNEVDAEVGGTLLGTWHRWWLDLRAWANAGDPTTVLAEVEWSEDAIKRTYELLLRRTAGNPLSPVLHRQFAEILVTHEQMHQLRETWDKER
jgi:uncharacterized protein (TIGR02284 family)